MSEKILKPNSGSSSRRKYEAEALAIQSLRLIAAPDPKDDLSDEEFARFCVDPRHSPELIKHLIEFIKKI